MRCYLGRVRVVRLFCITLALLTLAYTLQAQMQMNVEQLAEFIRSELALKQSSDKQVAAYVKKIQLTEKLTDKTILDLEAQGAGPKTVQALQELRDQSAARKAPAKDATYSPATAPDVPVSTGPPVAKLGTNQGPVIPPPDSVRQQQILDRIKQYAMTYTQSLPNFICVEVMRRYVDPNADHYRSLGDVLAKVSYNEGQEKYQVYSVNGHYEDTTMERAAASGGAISSGEFGSLMREIFEPRSEADFGWDHWATLRGRRMAVFNYSIDSGHSSWSITYSSGPGDEERIITGYKGTIYTDENTGEIARIRFVAVNIPKTFPVSEATETLDYDQVPISGKSYMCPLAAVLKMTAGREKTKNQIEFHNYRRFGTESDIKYDMDATAPAPPPLPASKTEEQPATAESTGTATTASTPASQQPAPSQKPSGTANTWSMPTPPPPPQ